MTTTDPQQQALELRARAHVQQLRSFYRLLGTAALVLAITFTVNYVTTPGRWWFLWVAFGFGIAIAFSGLNLLLRGRWLGAEWEERKVREYLERHPR
ncbi:MAG TPA: 2TM domain-containing protein [Burkholderiaceae bacterium]|nr:2TM domain-containing protein [Burkholderiaceae bacterium]